MDFLSLQFSRRLLTLASFVPEGASFVDVGTDHAYIPIYLAMNSKTSRLIATDVAKGPIESAKQNILQYHLEDMISIRFGNGLAPIQPGEVDTVLIAGMGGHTAVEILSAAPTVVKFVQKLIIQPMNASHLVRQFLDQNGFYLQDECVIEEDGRFYEIIVANRSGVAESYAEARDTAYENFRLNPDTLQFAYEFGPLLLERPTFSFIAMMKHTRDKWQKLQTDIARSNSTRAAIREAVLTRQIQLLNIWLDDAEERLADK
jgi:tRNA (adenine22-N1)-methyltransferase